MAISNWFKNLLAKLTFGLGAKGSIFDTFGSVVESLVNKYTGAGLTGAEQAQNDFNAEQADINRIFQSNEAALQRDWSAAEAERARDWQEEMYAKYNSLSGKVAQAEQAGVNPIFAVTGNAVSPMQTSPSVPSGASAGGSSASGSLGPADSFTNLIGQIIGLKKLESEIAVNDSVAEKNSADAKKLREETPLSVQKLISEISAIDMSAHVSGAQFNQIIEQTKNIVQERSNLVAQLNLTYDQAENLQAVTQKLISETEHLDKISDYEVRSAKAKAAVDEFDASLAELVNQLDEHSDEAAAAVQGLSKFGTFVAKYLISSKH